MGDKDQYVSIQRVFGILEECMDDVKSGKFEEFYGVDLGDRTKDLLVEFLDDIMIDMAVIKRHDLMEE